jgi:hypothetical protein
MSMLFHILLAISESIYWKNFASHLSVYFGQIVADFWRPVAWVHSAHNYYT